MASSTIFTLAAIVLIMCVYFVGAEAENNVKDITSSNFPELLEGEWMVEFYAPWCGACKQFKTIWESFGDWAADSNVDVRVAKVDVTSETMLSGQFMVTHLPTVFHIKNGYVRDYIKPRELTSLIAYIEDSEWREEEPRSWWRNPTAFHMRGIGLIFWVSEKAQEFQVLLQDRYQVPTYMVFVIIAISTIAVGLTLGGVAVCCIEVCMRLYGGRVKQTSSTRKLPRQHKSLQEMTERLPTKGTEQDEKEEEKMREEDEEEIEEDAYEEEKDEVEEKEEAKEEENEEKKEKGEDVLPSEPKAATAEEDFESNLRQRKGRETCEAPC